MQNKMINSFCSFNMLASACLFLGMLIFLSGCGGGTYSGAWGGEDYQGKIAEYSAVVNKTLQADFNAEQIASNLHRMKEEEGGTTYHIELCFMYGEIRDYNRFNSCVESWFQRDRQYGVKAKQCSPNSVDSQIASITMHYNRAFLEEKALFLLEQGREEESLSLLNGEVAFWFDKGQQCIQDMRLSRPDRRQRLGDHQWGHYSGAGNIYARVGKIEDARKMIRGLSQIDTNDPVLVQRIRLSKAKILFVLQDWQKAYLELEKVAANESISQLSQKFKTATYAVWAKYMLARSYYKLGKLQEAEPYYMEILAFPSTRDYGEIYYQALYDMAGIDIQHNRTDLAISRMEEAVQLVEGQRKTLRTDTSKVGYVGDKQQLYTGLVRLLVKKGQYAKAFEYVERAKARALIDILADKKKVGTGQQSVAAYNILKETQKKENQIIAVSSSTQPQDTAKLRSALAQQNRRLQKVAPEIASLVTVNPMQLAAIQARLGSGETLVEFYGDNDLLTTFLVTQDNVEAITLEGLDIAKEVDSLRQAILSYNSNDYKAIAQSLYHKIFVPLTPHIKTKNLTIVAHGSLHYLPFNALHDGDSFLIDKYSIRMLPSASVMEFLGKNTNKNDSMLVLANPDLGNAQYDLPAAEQEGQAIAKGKRETNVLSRKAATETALRKYGPTTSRLHIASHGQFKSEEPLKSRLLLAGDDTNDGNLTVDELYNLELNNDLVVLSACETGLGDVKNGDDVIGLTRGFLFAGVDSIVSSLWVVDDIATANLMVAFYDGLESQSKQEALRQAQLKIKNEYNEHPFFWAAFQLTGSM